MITEIIQKHPTLPIMCNAITGEVCRTEGRSAWKWTKGYNHKKGYRRIRVGRRHIWVHRIIAETFLDNPDNKPSVDHINRNKQDNRLANLRWATMLEQSKNTFKAPLKYGFSKDSNPKAYYREYNNSHKELRKHTKWVKYHFYTKMARLMNW